MTPPFGRILVANRGEIALRIIRASHELGMEAVAVYSDPDANAAHVRAADRSVRIGPAPAAESYLRGDAIIEAAIATQAEAVHPGYGFLAERAEFAEAVRDKGLVFVGPDHRAIAALGDKLAARRTAAAAGVPVVPGTLQPASVDRPDGAEGVIAEAEGIGFPLLVKAAAGGGGRGMRRVADAKSLPAALIAASHEAASAFGDGAVYLEREILGARHIEVQLLGDKSGTVLALGERDCSIQRRHQKLIEETPAPGLDEVRRRVLHHLAVRVATAAGLDNAATAEFLYAEPDTFWFLEVNTRLQVEHGVTELVTGIDIVAEQFRIAAGQALRPGVRAAAERASAPVGHAIEVRLSAEDPGRDFSPTPGHVTRWVMPTGPGIRVDTAIEAGERIPPDYDPLIAKILAHGPDRAAAIARMSGALDETEIGGIQSTLPFHAFVMRHPAFRAGDLSTGWVDDHWDGSAERGRAVPLALLAGGLAAFDAPPDGLPRGGFGSGPSVAAGSPWRDAGRRSAMERSPR
jgi:acetyl/propionyl-CoA carboxylase alpha subunit